MALATYRPDGTVRAIWDDDRLPRERFGARPHRASRVEVIASGMFAVDFVPLFELTGNPRYAVCLTQTFARHADALAAEVAWLRAHYIVPETPMATATDDDELCCRVCGRPMVINTDGTSNHVFPPGQKPPGTVDDVDYHQDRDHVAIAPADLA